MFASNKLINKLIFTFTECAVLKVSYQVSGDSAIGWITLYLYLGHIAAHSTTDASLTFNLAQALWVAASRLQPLTMWFRWVMDMLQYTTITATVQMVIVQAYLPSYKPHGYIAQRPRHVIDWRKVWSKLTKLFPLWVWSRTLQVITVQPSNAADKLLYLR